MRDPANVAAFVAAVRATAGRREVNLATIVDIAARHEAEVRAAAEDRPTPETLHDQAFAKLALGDFTAAAWNNLAQALKSPGRYAEAELLIRRFVTLFETSFGENHPDVALRLNNLAQLLQATNRLAKAEAPMRRHVEIFIQFTRPAGHVHPHLRGAIGNYAGCWRRWAGAWAKSGASWRG